ncbi:tRNA-splicing endonuclease subunit sen34 [Diplocarpon rosae]|nr:tRNA-splicing endonuclease subunit sen34 [Diplocarpon rosae]
MTASLNSVTEPIPISLIAGRYLLFDVNIVTYLRRTHHICGSLIGTLPQSPQQNLFFGLPMELMPEEAKLLVEKDVAYIIDDKQWHKDRLFNTLQGAEKQSYLESLRNTGLKSRKAALIESRMKTEQGLAKYAARKAQQSVIASTRSELPNASSPTVSLNDISSNANDAFDTSLFEEESLVPRKNDRASEPTGPLAVTPTTSYSPSSLPRSPTTSPGPPVPPSYALFAHLHARDYYLMPGLRFGCNYNVYPGDPLRFHSHFLATSYEFHQEIPMFDIIGGGRLGTAVKKGFLVGGMDPDIEEGRRGENVRTFCIEWAGM